MIRAVIVEDEMVSYKLLQKVLNDNCKDIEIVGYADTIARAIDLIKVLKPDVVFLDIQMPEGSGFTVLEAFDKVDFGIIFVTAYDQYAIKAIKWSALDYILKPVKPKDLKAAIDKFLKANSDSVNEMQHSALMENIKSSKNAPNKIVLPTNEEYHIVSPDDIIRCKSDNYYTNVFLTNGKKIMISKTLKEYELLLSDSGFIRTHNSHLINIKYIKTFVRSKGGYIVMIDDQIIPVSRRKKNEVLEFISNL